MGKVYGQLLALEYTIGGATSFLRVVFFMQLAKEIRRALSLISFNRSHATPCYATRSFRVEVNSILEFQAR